MPDVMLANKEEASNLKGRIEGQPLTGKVILCVLKTLAQAGTFKSTVGELKKYVLDCMRQSGSEDEILTIEDFLVLLETLVDSGLLRVFDDVDVKQATMDSFFPVVFLVRSISNRFILEWSWTKWKNFWTVN